MEKERGRPTVGQVSSELLQRDVYGDITAGEQMQEQLADYERSVLECVNTGKTIWPGDFFVTVVTKRERLMPNVFRNYFISRQTCPTPAYDQTVYRYDSKHDDIEFIWTLPSPVAIKNLLQHRHEIDPSFYRLLTFVLEFLDGTLQKRAQLLNKEIVYDGHRSDSITLAGSS